MGAGRMPAEHDSDHGLVMVGQKLAEQRAAQNLSQEQLAAQMHMGIEQLSALERGDVGKLPEPVFIKAMVRRLSSHLGLDADAMVSQLGQIPLATPKNDLLTAHSGPSIEPSRSIPRFNPLPLLAVAGVCGVAVAAWIGTPKLIELVRQFPPRQQATLPANSADLTLESEPEASEIVADQAEPATTESLVLTISSGEPSWIALRRNGVIEFEGLLDGERQIEQPDGVEIYAGRPDLIQVKRPEQTGQVLGGVKDIRWIPLNAER